jgi:uncharacterized protein (DUF2235 family)
MLAALIHKVGLLAPQQRNLADAALTAYKQSKEVVQPSGVDEADSAEASEAGPLSADDRAAQFARIVSVQWPTIKFLGVWDTVASVIPGLPPRQEDRFGEFCAANPSAPPCRNWVRAQR